MASKPPPKSSLLSYGFQRTATNQQKKRKVDTDDDASGVAHSDASQADAQSEARGAIDIPSIEPPVADSEVNSEQIPDAPTTTQHLTLATYRGDIFAAPSNTVLIHACNTQGSWGAGIAAAFRIKYPEAFKVYRDHCLRSHNPRTNPVRTGTCLLIPPCETKSGARTHWIACLFTSARYGKGKDKPDVILRNTGPSMNDLLGQIKKAEEDGKTIAGLRMCKINSARFGVPWHKSVEVLKNIEIGQGERGHVDVWTIDED